MWVRTTVTIERWTEENTGLEAGTWDERARCDVNRLPSWERRHLLPGLTSSTDASTFSEGECKESDRCCWKHTQCARHIIHPFSDCGHHNLHLHSVGRCDCDSRCKSYRPVSVAVIHHPIHHDKPSIPTQVGPIVMPTDLGMGTVPGAPDSAAPITIWRSESPTGKGQGNKVIKKIKKKKENEKDKDKEEEMTDEKAKPKKKVKKGKLMKKKSPVKSESSPADLSPRELARMSESSPESRADLDSEDSYHKKQQDEHSSEDILESSSPRRREKSTTQAKKNGTKTSSQARKVTKRKSPPLSSPNLS
uniref:Protein interacting with cyclin A1 n=1 Tax=Chinchilla lanigera TaxID=34839 RepID=A0A8C2V0M2_CHILA